MGVKAKIVIVVLLFVVVMIALWQFTSPAQLPVVGDKYASQLSYANRGSWTILENTSYGRAYFAFSIANTSYPRTTLPTYYELTISNLNQTVTNPLVKGFGVRVTTITLQDNLDGSTSKWGITENLTDAVQAAGVFNFHTSAIHELRFTLTYQLYDLLLVGSIPDKTFSDSFNATQNVL
jgi:hypothetical protein